MASDELMKSGDAQQYRSEAMPEAVTKSGLPKVTLLNATPDPLGSIAALCGIYTGRVIRDLSEVTDEERRQALEDMSNTALSGPLEAVQFHFLVEGVDRSFTHQAVRGRNAFYAQESMRFAVVDEEPWAERTTLPPSLTNTIPVEQDVIEFASSTEWRSNEQLLRNSWDRALEYVQAQYKQLIEYGMPAEEARGLMPHAIKTRYHWIVDLRELLHVAGLRTCTQAQFHWRLVMAEIARCLRSYHCNHDENIRRWDQWQFELIADKIRPVCYQTGRCGFMAAFDRHCSIRDRVERNARRGRPSSDWHEPVVVERCTADSDCPGGCGMEEEVTLIHAIRNDEWAIDPGAARK
jgi:flavin-dependent thymidylate synthase